MKVLVLSILLALAAANPIPEDEDVGDPIEVIVNGLPDGEPLEINHIVDIKLKEHVDGQLASATNVLYPFTAEGLAAAAVLEDESQPELPAPVNPALPEPERPEPIVPEPIVPEPIEPEPIVPEPIVPEPETPVAPEPEPEQPLPSPIVIPEPSLPEVAPNPEEPVIVNPEPILVPELQIPNGEIYNDGLVQVSLNAPQEPGVFSTLQSWFNMVLNYINNGVQTTHQIV